MTRSSTPFSRFIPSEEIDAQNVRQWRFGEVDQAQPGGTVGAVIPSLAVLSDLLPPPAPAPHLPQEAEKDADAEAESGTPLQEAQVQQLLEQARQEAREAGYQQGLQEGRAQGQQEGRQSTALEWQQKLDDYQSSQGRETAQQLLGVLQGAERDVQGMQQRMAPDVLQLACDIARQVVRQELRSNPQALLPVVREALDMLSAESKPATVRLNPQDWEQLKGPLKDAFPQPKIEWLADASVAVGDCRVDSAGAQVDGSMERRWQRAVAALGLVSTWYDGAPAHGQ